MNADRSCGHWNGAAATRCGATTGVRHYLPGYRCPAHTPAAVAGQPEAPEPDGPLHLAWAAPNPQTTTSRST